MEALGPAVDSSPELQAGGRVPGGQAVGEGGLSFSSRAWRTTGPYDWELWGRGHLSPERWRDQVSLEMLPVQLRGMCEACGASGEKLGCPQGGYVGADLCRWRRT